MWHLLGQPAEFRLSRRFRSFDLSATHPADQRPPPAESNIRARCDFRSEWEEKGIQRQI